MKDVERRLKQLRLKRRAKINVHSHIGAKQNILTHCDTKQ